MSDYRLVITIKDVSIGDVRQLAEDVETEHGDAFDAHLGHMTFEAQERAGDSWFRIDLEEVE